MTLVGGDKNNSFNEDPAIDKFKRVESSEIKGIIAQLEEKSPATAAQDSF